MLELFLRLFFHPLFGTLEAPDELNYQRQALQINFQAYLLIKRKCHAVMLAWMKLSLKRSLKYFPELLLNTMLECLNSLEGSRSECRSLLIND
jgi:hypothetical protein